MGSLRLSIPRSEACALHMTGMQRVSTDGDSCVLRVSRRKALPARYSRNTVASICTDSLHSSHVQGTCITSWDAKSRATCENFFNLHSIITCQFFPSAQSSFCWIGGVLKPLSREILVLELIVSELAGRELTASLCVLKHVRYPLFCYPRVLHNCQTFQ